MKKGVFYKECKNKEIHGRAERILGKSKIKNINRICECYGDGESDYREYDVYRITNDLGERILKKAGQWEVINYEKYLNKNSFLVPQYYGSINELKHTWIIIEYIKGSDLRFMTDDLAKSAAKSISQIMNYFWNNNDSVRFDVYKNRINKRYKFIKDTPIIGKAYKIFLERQETCPRTLSNGDFLEFNLIESNGQVNIIDWGFGGVMPYTLDIARFIAHGTKDMATFPFYMTENHKKTFINTVYDNLNEKPNYNQYLYDIKLAVLNEYVEFIEAGEDENNWYFEHSKVLAEDILDY